MGLLRRAPLPAHGIVALAPLLAGGWTLTALAVIAALAGAAALQFNNGLRV
jgi:hypothetical protein